MTTPEPTAKLDARFSSDEASPTPWPDARLVLSDAPISWISTVRPDGRPHVTPINSVWFDGALYFCTGPTERKAMNLAANTGCVLTTGTNAFDHGLDVVVEADAMPVCDEARLHQIAEAYEAKYGSDWHFDVRDGNFHSEDGGTALVFELAPVTVFGFSKGEPFSQTRWRFDHA